MSLRGLAKRLPGLVPAVAALRRARARLGRALAHGPQWFRPAPDGLPVPPPELLFRVSGAANVEWFLEGGRRALLAIDEALAGAGVVLPPGARVLDFGCGCGRVARWWLRRGGVVLTGTDADAAAVGWCRRRLPGGRFLGNGALPPLALPDGAFDLAYALSVFTHLPADRQRKWLAELKRVLAPGGLLVVSLHGDAYLDELGPPEREAFLRGEIVVVGGKEAGSNACNAFHPQRAAREILADWEILAFRPCGALGNPRQDLWLVRREKT